MRSARSHLATSPQLGDGRVAIAILIQVRHHYRLSGRPTPEGSPMSNKGRLISLLGSAANS
jgi:hypothetical protein